MKETKENKEKIMEAIIEVNDIGYIVRMLFELEKRLTKIEEEKEMRFLKRRKK